MTRKHFKTIAAAIHDSPLSHEAKEAIARRLAYEFVAFNPRFDVQRFIRACTAN